MPRSIRWSMTGRAITTTSRDSGRTRAGASSLQQRAYYTWVLSKAPPQANRKNLPLLFQIGIDVVVGIGRPHRRPLSLEISACPIIFVIGRFVALPVRLVTPVSDLQEDTYKDYAGEDCGLWSPKGAGIGRLTFRTSIQPKEVPTGAGVSPSLWSVAGLGWDWTLCSCYARKMARMP